LRAEDNYPFFVGCVDPNYNILSFQCSTIIPKINDLPWVILHLVMDYKELFEPFKHKTF
jgi:hypothetical protein